MRLLRLLRLFLLGLTMPFAFTRFASFFGSMRFAFFRCHVWRRFDSLFAQPLVLNLLLVLNHPLFVFALERLHFFGSKRFVRQQVIVNQ